ncbi:MAG: iron complex outermembrane receptor protein [Candidatus Azotimanducaceae bacterium]|jgi:iron complex outermembrane receptor protein
MIKLFSGCLLASLAVTQLHAAEHDIEEVVVTGPFHKPLAESALPIGVLSGEALRREVANSLGGTLDSQPGVHSSSFGPGVGQPVIRGQSGKRVQVLQNSVFVSDAANLSPDHGNGIEPLLADSIEVVRGPATLLYGSGAIGGVVNVIDQRIPTRLFERPEVIFEQSHLSVSDEDKTVFGVNASVGTVALHADFYSRRNNNVDVSGSPVDLERLEALEALAGIVHDEDEEEGESGPRGYIDNSFGEGEGGTFGISWVQEQGFIGFSYNRFESEYGLPAGAHAHEEEHGEEHGEEDVAVRLALEQERYDLKADYHFDQSFISDVRFHLGYTDYEHSELEIEDGVTELGTRFLNKGFDSRISLTTRERGQWQGVWGLQVNATEFSATGEEAFIPKTDIQNTALFAVERWTSDRYTLELGGRVERAELDPAACATSETVFSISASGIVDLEQDARLIISAGRTERAPTVEERYSNIEVAGCGVNTDLVAHAATNLIEIGDVDLDTEISRNLDISYRLPIGSALLDVSGFYNQVNDYVYLDLNGVLVDDTQVASYRGQDARFYGFEASLEFPLAQLDASSIGGRITMDMVRGRFDNDDYVPRMSPARILFAVDWESQRWSSGMTLSHVFEQDDTAPLELRSIGYTLVSAYADYHWVLASDAELTLFAKGDNLLNEEVRNHVSFLNSVAPEAGRGVRVGLRLNY